MNDQLMKQLQALMRSPQANKFMQTDQMKMLQDYRSGKDVLNPTTGRPEQFLPQAPGIWIAPPAPPAPPPINLGGGVSGGGAGGMYYGGEGADSSPDGGLGMAGVDGMGTSGIGIGGMGIGENAAVGEGGGGGGGSK